MWEHFCGRFDAGHFCNEKDTNMVQEVMVAIRDEARRARLCGQASLAVI